MPSASLPHVLAAPVRYDAARRRLWICGQRCHHGAVGALAAAVAGGGLIGPAPSPPNACAALVAAGTLLMVHDWQDRAIWFQRGAQDQP